MKTLRTLGSPIALAAALALAAPLFIGSATASDRNVDRTVSIDSSTRWVNVNGGETIRFIANGKSFDHRFNSGTHSNVYDLGKIVPVGMLDHSLKVYVSPDPAFAG
jgi:hypothetical protein